MKKLFLLVVFLFSVTKWILAFPPADTTGADSNKNKVVNKPDAPQRTNVVGLDTVHVDFQAKNIDTISVRYITRKGDTLKVSLDSLLAKLDLKIGKAQSYKELDGWEILLVFTPLLVFLVLFFVIGRVNGFDFQNALTENDVAKKTIENPKYKEANLLEWKDVPNLAVILPPTIEVSKEGEFRPSISRYIAFISSILTLVVALSMSCFFIYHYIRSGEAPDLGPVSVILMALGIGVLPYAFNKVSTAVSKDRSS